MTFPTPKKLALAMAASATLALGSTNAFALLDFTQGNINNFDIDLDEFWLSDVNQLNWTGWEFSDFGDTGGPDTPGSTFTNYLILTLTSGVRSDGTTVGFGLNPDLDDGQDGVEVTAFVSAEGQMLSDPGAFELTQLLDFEMYLDPLEGATQQASGTNIAGYMDGTLKLSASSLSALPTPGNPLAPNSGILIPNLGAGGSANFQTNLVEEDPLFYTTDRTESLFTAVSPLEILQVSELQLTLQVLQDNGQRQVNNNNADFEAIFDEFVDYFGIDDSLDRSQTLIQASPTTNIAAVPTPGILALLGIGLLGLGVSLAKRRVA